jgi:cell division septum initiation protein DivIVA
MTDPAKRDKEAQADEARSKLAKAEQGADDTLERAAEELRELTEEQQEHAERLRKEARNPTGQPPASKPEEKDQE